MGQIKGVVLQTSRAWVVTRSGEEGWRLVLRAMPEADQEHLQAIVSVGWYDIGIEDRLNRTIDSVLGRGNLALMPLIGRFSADHEMKTFHKLFVRSLSPDNIIDKLTDFWRRYQDTGTWKVTRVAPHQAKATLDGWASAEVATHLRLTAYIGRIIEMTGFQRSKFEHVRCRLRGDSLCEFSSVWEP